MAHLEKKDDVTLTTSQLLFPIHMYHWVYTFPASHRGIAQRLAPSDYCQSARVPDPDRLVVGCRH